MAPEHHSRPRDDGWGPLQAMSVRARWTLTAVLGALLVITLSAALVATWADRVLLNEDRFSARIASTLRQDEMNRYLAGEITEQVLARAPELMGVRPAIEAVLSEALRTRTAIVGARSALRAAHRDVRAGLAEESINIDLHAVFTLAAALMQRGAPDVAERFEAGLDTTRLDAGAVGLRTGVFERLDQLTGAIWPLAGGAALLAVGLVAVAPSRRDGLLVVAGAVALAGLTGLVGQRLAELWFVEQLPAREDARVAVTLAWRSVFREYTGWNAGLLALGIAGLAGAVATAKLPDRQSVRDFAVTSVWGRTITGATLALGGLAVARWPLDAVRVIVVAAGIMLASGGVILLLRSTLSGMRDVRPIDYARRLRAAPLVTAVALLSVVAVGATIGIWFAGTLRAEPSPVEPAPISVCNGHELLCDRPLDQVTFAGTHNSMAAASQRGWYFPAQRHGIADQLRDGIHALLIDTYYAIPSPQGVLTVIDPDVRRPQLVAEHGEEVVAAAERIAANLAADAEPELYLCHSFCELGATPLGAVLVDIRDYLDANPGDFLVIIMQDAISPGDTVAAFEAADLAERAYAHPPGEPWPTLGELLHEGKQLLVMAEDNAGAADWYQLAYDGLLQETEFRNTSLATLDCRPGRGGAEAPIFLMNHWISRSPALPSQALEANDREFLLGRARRCADERGRVPNIVAVNFYDVGDLFEAVDALNGVAPASEDVGPDRD